MEIESSADCDIQHILNISEIIEPSLWPQCCIYKVPTTLLKVKDEAYTPLLISIGPIHHNNNKKLEEMQEYKHRYFHYFWNRLDSKNDLMNYKEFLQQEDQNIRRCYQKKFYDISNEQMVDMILLDSVFIMELFLRENKKWEHKDDYIITQLCVSRSIQRDLLLIENQLPMYVLEKLYGTVVPNNVKNHNLFTMLAHDYFASCYPHHQESSKRMFEEKNWEKSFHFTDLIRSSYLPMKLSNQHIDSQRKCLKPRTATKLKQVGISFQKVHNRCLLDIKFQKKPFFSWFLCLGCLPCFKAKFLFPQLKVDHTTECVLRNLMAFEQCHYPDEPYICNYVSFLDSLIHTKDDAELLVEKEVIVHELGSDEELANLVNGLCKHIVMNSSCYFQLMEDLDEHWRTARGKLRRSFSKIAWIATLIFRVFQLLLRR
ncbi:hypothetical protein MtrunA17_Chr8g0334951 [Medicago truncatula]|uniref:DUF247 domain protein n=1 Tax=Medicago truncatula TaxID=3880 RepID=A0A072THG0_MEDTR|nr:UPF0481 protein At3g47200 [Medicago truncatula]KEH16373.1 DUF247 domain protein [Medicago truncatula]KEH16375.1 DUF247 domain protein [Medicago truncatula]RHN38599.1 hypothetical protein MtrunA17_Chr8g0334951 [Medicago truncatula]